MLWYALAMICKCRWYGEKSRGVKNFCVPVSLSVLCRLWEISWHIESWLSSLSFNPWCPQIGRLHVIHEPLQKSQKIGFQSKAILETRSVKQETTPKPISSPVNQVGSMWINGSSLWIRDDSWDCFNVQGTLRPIVEVHSLLGAAANNPKCPGPDLFNF